MEHDEKIGKTVHRLDRLLYRNLSYSARMAGVEELTIVHGWIIRYLYENRERDVFQRDLEREFGVCRSSVTSTIQIMERNGYLKREPVKQDARLKKVVLTEKGLKSHEKMECVIKNLQDETLEGISEEEFAVFMAVADKMERNLLRQQKNEKSGRRNRNK